MRYNANVNISNVTKGDNIMKKILTLTQKGVKANLYKFGRQPLSLSLVSAR
jgi:hypothetical protein